MELKHKNISIFVDEVDYREFKAKLAIMGESIGPWMKKQIYLLINKT